MKKYKSIIVKVPKIRISLGIKRSKIIMPKKGKGSYNRNKFKRINDDI